MVNELLLTINQVMNIQMDANKTREYLGLIFSCLVIFISLQKDFYFLKKSCTASLGTIFSSKT